MNDDVELLRSLDSGTMREHRYDFFVTRNILQLGILNYILYIKKALTLRKILLKKKINCSVRRNVSCGILLVIGAAKGMGSDID
jgi:hypothetical protein